jgi:hypothetical protein
MHLLAGRPGTEESFAVMPYALIWFLMMGIIYD